jgi:hypothetical protein
MTRANAESGVEMRRPRFLAESTHDNLSQPSSTGMSTDHVFNVDAASPQKQDLARQIVSANQDTDRGLLTQLTNNPFFTAVSPCAPSEAMETIPWHTHTLSLSTDCSPRVVGL